MKLRIDISTYNAAFNDNPREETVRALQEIANQVFAGFRAGSIRDSNGNRVGSFVFQPGGDE